MTHSELHMAVRALLIGKAHQSFSVSVRSREYHPNRILVEYEVYIHRTNRDPLFYGSMNPRRLLGWIRCAVNAGDFNRAPPADEAPPLLRAIGSPPILRRVK